MAQARRSRRLLHEQAGSKTLTISTEGGSPVLAAAAVVRDGDGRILLVRRANPPEAGRWSIPGGRVEAGESLETAAVREAFEETGVTVRIVREVWCLELADGRGGTYELHDFLAEYVSAEIRAGDDASDVGWFTPAELTVLPLTHDLLGYLTRYGVLPAQPPANP